MEFLAGFLLGIILGIVGILNFARHLMNNKDKWGLK